MGRIGLRIGTGVWLGIAIGALNLYCGGGGGGGSGDGTGAGTPASTSSASRAAEDAGDTAALSSDLADWARSATGGAFSFKPGRRHPGSDCPKIVEQHTATGGTVTITGGCQDCFQLPDGSALCATFEGSIQMTYQMGSPNCGLLGATSQTLFDNWSMAFDDGRTMVINGASSSETCVDPDTNLNTITQTLEGIALSEGGRTRLVTGTLTVKIQPPSAPTTGTVASTTSGNLTETITEAGETFTATMVMVDVVHDPAVCFCPSSGKVTITRSDETAEITFLGCGSAEVSINGGTPETVSFDCTGPSGMDGADE